MKRGILLLNTGSPEKPDAPATARYLRQFLSDPRIIDLPFIARMLLVHFIIVPFRAFRSASLYRKIWTQKGSPLIVISESQAEGLQKILDQKYPDQYAVSMAMRYGSPDIRSALENFYQQGIRSLATVPMFPQNASATTGSVKAAVYQEAGRFRNPFFLTVVLPWYRHPAYIHALAVNAAEHIESSGLLEELDSILFTYHGLPERHILKDSIGGHCSLHESCCNSEGASLGCYRAQCMETSRLTAEELKKITEKKGSKWAAFWKRAHWSVSFQSRLGKDPWIGPHTEEVLAELGSKGRSTAVYAPSFTTDCLETLHEIAEEGRELFLEAGGRNYYYIPALNTHPLWLESLSQIVLTFFPADVETSKGERFHDTKRN